MASAKTQDNTGYVLNTLSQKASIFLRAMAEEVVNIADPKTPKKTGRLKSDVLKQVLGLKGKIVWSKEYAAIQEIKQFSKYTTPGTGPHYAENAVRETIDKTQKIAKSSGLL